MSTLFCSFFFILLLLGGRCYGQSFTIEGQVVNTKNQPIEFMDVYLTHTSDSNMPHVYTDSLGRFILNAERGIYTLKIDQFGKELWMKTIDLVKDIDLGVLAIDNAVLLEEVTINAIKNFVKHKGDKLLFDIENSPLAKGYNGLEVLRRSPKLQISSDGSIQLRKKEVQVLVNGRKATMGQEDLNHYLESLSSEDIRSIEIQDVAAADTEASNSGGIVNIVLKKEIYGLRGIVKTSGTYYKPRYNNFLGDINLIYGHEKWNVYFISGVSKNRSKGLYNNQFDYSNSRRQHQHGIFLQDNKSYNFRTGIVFYPNIKHEFGGEFFLRNGKDKLTDYQLLKIYNPTVAIEGETNSLTHDKTAIWYVTINYKYSIDTLGSYLKFIGDYGSNRLNRYNTGNIIYALGQMGDSNFLFDTKAPSIYYTGQVDWLQKLKSNWQLFSGVKFNRITRSNELNSSEKRDQDRQLMPKGIEDFKNTENIVAIYISVEKSITKHNYLKVGLRGEFTSVTGINKINNEDVKGSYVDLFPSLFYKYSMDNKHFLSLAVDYFLYSSAKKNKQTTEMIQDLDPLNHTTVLNNNNAQHIDNLASQIDFELPYTWGTLEFGGKISFTKINSDIDIETVEELKPVNQQEDQFTYRENTQAFYFSGAKSWGEKWQIKTGLRAESTQNEGSSSSVNQTNKKKYMEFFPTLYIAYKLNDNHDISFRYGKRIQRPSYANLNPARWYLSSTSYEEGNPFLQPSFTTTLELSHSFKNRLNTTVSFSQVKDGFGQLTTHNEEHNFQKFTQLNYYSMHSINYNMYASIDLLPWWSNTFEFNTFYVESKTNTTYLKPKYSGWGAYFIATTTLTLNKAKTVIAEISYEQEFDSCYVGSEVGANSNVTAGIKFFLLDKKLQCALNANNIFGSDRMLLSNTTQNVFQTFKQYYDTQYIRFSLSYSFGNKNITVKQQNSSNEEEKRRVN